MNPREEAAAFDFRDLWRTDAGAGRQLALADYQSRFPGFEARIASEWAALTEPELAAPAAAPAPEPLGPYRLLRMLGRGGQGTVYLAEDTRLQHRQVALKVLDPTAAGLSTARIARLRREAEALARLDHPGICAMLEAQLDSARPFLAMRLIAGETLQARLAAAAAPPRTTAELHATLQLLERAALAAHAAHEAGIVHRDLKPANIMVDRDGRPVLLDFGLAREEDPHSLGLTLSGEVFGTLAYMSPEQLAGDRDLDRRADVYALGVTLYECLTGVRPFAATSREAVTADIRTGRHTGPRTHNPAVPRDLAVVVEKAMDLARERRYATAREFADDLANVRERRPITARPKHVWLHAWRWTQRHPIAASTLAVLVLALAALSGLLWQMHRQSRELQQQTGELLAWKRAMTAVSIAETDPGRALDEAVAAAADRSQHEIRAALHRVLDANWQTFMTPMSLPGVPRSGVVAPPALLADRRTVVAITEAGGLLLWDLANGSLVGTVDAGHAEQGSAVTLLHDGRHLVTSNHGGAIKVWDAGALRAGATAIATLPGDGRAILCLAADADGGFFAGGAGDRLEHCTLPEPAVATAGLRSQPLLLPGAGFVYHVWPHPRTRAVLVHSSRKRPDATPEQVVHLLDAGSGAVVATAEFPDAPTLQGEWSPAGDRFVLAAASGVLQMHDADGALLWRHDQKSLLNAAHFRPDGRQLATFGFQGLSVLDPGNGDVLHHRPSATGRSFENGWFAPGGDLIAVAVRDSTMRLFETGRWQELALLGPTVLGYARWALWGDDERLVLCDHTAMLGFHGRCRPHLPLLLGHSASIVSVALQPAGRLLASAAEDQTIRVWDLDTCRPLRTLPCAAAPSAVRASPTQWLAVTGEPVARLWPWTDGPPLELRGHTAKVTDGWFLAQGAQVLTLGADGTARLWSATDGTQLRTFTADCGPLRTAAFDEGQGLLAVAGDGPRVQLFALGTGAPGQLLTAPHAGTHWGLGTQVSCLHFDPHHRRLYAASLESPVVVCWDRDRNWATSELGGMSAGSTGWAVTDPRGRWLICAELWIGRTRWFDARTHAVLPWDERWEPGTKISRVAFRADGELALLASWDGTVRLFDMQQLQPWSVLRSSHGGAMDACFSSDGNSVAVGYRDGAILVWPVDPYPAAAGHLVRRYPK